MSVLALIPAHQEAANIAATVASLLGQTTPPDRVVVIADNCTDDTAAVAESAGATVFTTVGNTERKAGALNQALGSMTDLPEHVLVMDADTTLAPRFVEAAVQRLNSDAGIAAIGGIFQGPAPTSLVETAQANEYARYARELGRTGRVMVLSGTATVFRRTTIEAVRAARGTTLPGIRGDFYRTNALTEDNEITLAVKTLGLTVESPRECVSTTELMPSFGPLHRQRLRWYRGAMEDLLTYGFTTATRRYWGQQAMLALGTLMMSLYLLLTVHGVVTGTLGLSPWWMLLGAVFWAEKLVTAWGAGPRGRLLAALLIPELVYDLFLQATLVRALLQTVRRREAVWHHDTSLTPLTTQGA
ncbi:glycosyltransferase family 2 protein [Terracoccus luteus]|uniref:Cellulose synthase/poly-beta-1,6-N-acetylglucosamine synthase-like glycosyltransferase n=1 Tax=Terracoccus luteus TaxID=53356 RepID=A0A839PZG4_9MICO|nr:glycosyltransferase family 2 protein [Terracoccus luteus]MBB2987415.1 cellulose synthase/poly-beta-1,6-N-acetylglucosamine synthase-like glycosyltransferase [Terracoccus luteus]MCP2173066.1 cellulose synthase/poly-beta-1,6-N-acetylglucosamine synthase-like glycosyltransferase [Terracoccus luteus]